MNCCPDCRRQSVALFMRSQAYKPEVGDVCARCGQVYGRVVDGRQHYGQPLLRASRWRKPTGMELMARSIDDAKD